MSWVADGQDGNRLHLEKTGLIFSSLSVKTKNLQHMQVGSKVVLCSRVGS